MTKTLIQQAENVLHHNDRGNYTVPTPGLYPFQWNWDSALSALGFIHFNEPRAWTEIGTLMSHQWPDGMVPHIIFHEEDDGYFPGPKVWGAKRPVPTSGITQPPVTGFVVRRLMELARNKPLAGGRARTLLPKIHAWHQWFYKSRDPGNSGLVAIVHPWESGRDNSVDWDEALARVPTEGVEPFTRRDTEHADPSHRPTLEQYKRYIWLVQHFRALGWDASKMHDASPFQMVDPGLNAILIRSCSDLAHLAEQLGEQEIAAQSQNFVTLGIAAMDRLWSDRQGQYLCMDRMTGRLVESPSIGGLMPIFAPIPKKRAAALAKRIDEIGKMVKFLVPSHDPAAPEFDALRYWRGPSWLIANYMIADGLDVAGYKKIAARIKADGVRLIKQSGFAEYYHPLTGAPCGGGQFTWTAAMIIEMLSNAEFAA